MVTRLVHHQHPEKNASKPISAQFVIDRDFSSAALKSEWFFLRVSISRYGLGNGPGFGEVVRFPWIGVFASSVFCAFMISNAIEKCPCFP